MAALTNQNFVTYQGDDVFPIFTVEDGAGAVVDISTVTQITWWCQLTVEDGAVLTKRKSAGEITFVTNGTDGRFQVEITATDTALLDGWYQHMARITDALGNATTVAVGRMQVGVKPTWTYNAAKVDSVPLYQVRRWLGDVIAQDPQMSDSEILYAISCRSSSIGAAADCARQLGAQYARKVDTTSPGPISTAYGAQAKKYAELAVALDQLARARGAGITPYAGGISVADKVAVQSNSDRVQPNFTIGMMDNTLPVGQLGVETPTEPMNGTGVS